MNPTRFTLNGRPVVAENLQPTSTLLRWLRDQKGLTGTKEGCAEGDCGACSVVVVDPLGEQGPTLRSVNSCLMLTQSLEGQQVFTVEGLQGDDETPHPVQEAMVKHLGSQCGYCTPGFIMAMAEGAHRSDLDEPWKLNDQLCGNLCRCTGYRPIRDALRDVAGTCPADGLAKACREGGEIGEVESEGFSQPQNLAALFAQLERTPDAQLVAGATLVPE